MRNLNKKPIAHYSVDKINDRFFIFWYWFPCKTDSIVQSLINPKPEEVIELFHKYEMVEVR